MMYRDVCGYRKEGKDSLRKEKSGHHITSQARNAAAILTRKVQRSKVAIGVFDRKTGPDCLAIDLPHMIETPRCCGRSSETVGRLRPGLHLDRHKWVPIDQYVSGQLHVCGVGDEEKVRRKATGYPHGFALSDSRH